MHMKTDEMLFLLLCWLCFKLLWCCARCSLLYICSPCFCVEVTASFSHCVIVVCPSVLLLLLNYSYFYLTKMKYESIMMLFFFFFICFHGLDSFTCCVHCLCFLFLWFVTRHPSPPTSLRFWSALGWLVIMLMQLCSIKVSAPTYPPAHHHDHPLPSPFACLPPASTHVCL